MQIKKINIFIADCGRKYFTKKSCLKHDINCKCWTNPKYKTCKTCKFAKFTSDNNGMLHESQNLEKWSVIKCSNQKFDYDLHFTPAHEKAADLCINCPVWDINKKNT